VLLKTGAAFLESSVTVACRPSERKGYGDYQKRQERRLRRKVAEEVESLYELGFRGADLLISWCRPTDSMFWPGC
jgi:adenine-specific DNA methylase